MATPAIGPPSEIAVNWASHQARICWWKQRNGQAKYLFKQKKVGRVRFKPRCWSRLSHWRTGTPCCCCSPPCPMQSRNMMVNVSHYWPKRNIYVGKLRKRKTWHYTHHTAFSHNRINFGIKIFCHLRLNLHPRDVSQCFGTFMSHLKLRSWDRFEDCGNYHRVLILVSQPGQQLLWRKRRSHLWKEKSNMQSKYGWTAYLAQNKGNLVPEKSAGTF